MDEDFTFIALQCCCGPASRELYTADLIGCDIFIVLVGLLTPLKRFDCGAYDRLLSRTATE